MIKKYSQLKKDVTPLLQEALKYPSSEAWLRSGGANIDLLDKVAFGVTSGLKELRPEQLKVKHKPDMENVLWDLQKSGLSKRKWAEQVKQVTPIEVSYEKGNYYIEDGHHRYYAAKILGIPLKANVEVKGNPIAAITDLNYDEFHRHLWDLAHKK